MAHDRGWRKKADWDSRSVRALRHHLGLSQQKLSQELGVRQQTISEWESGKYKPRGACARVLTLVAERAEFSYQTALEPSPSPEGETS